MAFSASKLLIVDNDADNLYTLIKLLTTSPHKYQPIMANSGQHALDILQTHTPNLIITDWHMPVMNGIELTRAIRDMPTLKLTPVIIVTGISTSAKSLQQAFEVGASDYLTRPFHPTVLYARIDAALQMHYAMTTIGRQQQTIEDQKNRELSLKAINLAQKNRLLREIKQTLKQELGLKGLDNNDKQNLQRILRQIDKNLLHLNEWQVFSKYFEAVYPHFFRQILRHTPDLNQEELMQCAYIKIGLTNKEIAQVLGIEPESVTKQHYRLKKKMSIASKQSLHQVIRDIT